MYKVKNQMAPSCLAEIFSFKNSRYSRRHGDLEIPRFGTVNYGKHPLRYFLPMLWSRLPSEIKNSISLDVFKNKIRNYDICSLVENNSNCCDICNT